VITSSPLQTQRIVIDIIEISQVYASKMRT
jgi:hypothetical protein